MSPQIVFDFDPRNLPDDILAAIGLATAASSQTESAIEMAIAGCLGVDGVYGLAITTHMSAPLRDSVLRAAAEIRIDDLDALDELDDILDHIKNVALPKRNAIVHQSWAQDPESGEVFLIKQTARGSVDAELIPMSVNKIKSEAAIIYDAGIRLIEFAIKNDILPDFDALPPERAHKTRAARKKRRKG